MTSTQRRSAAEKRSFVKFPDPDIGEEIKVGVQKALQNLGIKDDPEAQGMIEEGIYAYVTDTLASTWREFLIDSEVDVLEYEEELSNSEDRCGELTDTIKNLQVELEIARRDLDEIKDLVHQFRTEGSCESS